VDDNSPDGTAAIAKSLSANYPISVLERRAERGLSTSVMEGFSVARGDILMVMDADLSHPVESIPEMIKPLIDGDFDITVGSRYILGGGCDEWSLARRITSRAGGLLAKGITSLSDPTGGFMAVKRDIIEGVNLDPIGWKIVLETVVRTNGRVKEIPIRFGGRVKGESNLSAAVQFQYVAQLWRLYRFRYPKLVSKFVFSIMVVLALVWVVVVIRKQ